MNAKQLKAQRRRARQKENRKLGDKKLRKRATERYVKAARKYYEKDTQADVPVKEVEFGPCSDWSLLTVGMHVRFKRIEMCTLGNGVRLGEYGGKISKISCADSTLKLDQYECEFALVDLIDLEYQRDEQ